MSLRDGRHEVFVETGTGEIVEDSLGVPHRLEAQFIPVGATVQWNEAQETGELLPEPGSTVTVIGRAWPGRPNGHFRWAGYEFEQIGPVMTFDGSPMTAHVEVKGRLVGEVTG
ncbi:hypothetical protein HMPREF3167_03385 [Trueperella sp. HMSC08B05]|uniref:Uncharacterized protein n=1 Tax=Trueperella bernardiae TaxID=59561 RepID=A0AAW6ZK45_9ACTO|nr:MULTISPECIES: hypothetical protein [Trueperella]MDK8602111.1 hypothetical protein [Trueperella bernardiae]OFS75654.1 hypothetical protein HMPREF3167_03385 [Trueperella sp. HMSC08B05]